MTTAVETRVLRPRTGPYSWGLWAERAVIRALDIDPDNYVQNGLLCGQSTSQVALVIARAIGYLAGTQRSPELGEHIRNWLDHVGLVEPTQQGSRLGGLAWADWAERASLVAMEIDPGLKMQTPLLYGQYVWEVAIAISRAVAFFAGVRKLNSLPIELHEWLQKAPRLGMRDDHSPEEVSR